MMKTFLRMRNRISFLASIAGLASLPVMADEQKNKTESKTTASSTAQVEVRVKSEAGDDKADSKKGDQQVTVVLNVSGDQADVVKKSIEKLEAQLKNRGISDALQQKALEALRTQITKSSGDGQAFSGKASWSSSGQPIELTSKDQKERLRDGIREALEEAGVASDVIEKALKGVDKKLNQFGAQRGFSWSATGKLPYRVGIGCKVKDEGDSQAGLEIETVFEDTPAAKAGLKPGDRLISIDSQPIHSHDDIVAAVQKAGEANRTVQVEAMRGTESMKVEIKPEQTALAEMNIELFQPGWQPGSPFRGQAWVMPQLPNDGSQLWNDPKIQERIRDAVKDAMETARRATDDRGSARGSRKENASAEEQNEKNIDKLQNELREVQKNLEEMKETIKKLTDKP
jgi:C-terminal processing protease CtpA/Prc